MIDLANGLKITRDGTREWYKDGQLHRVGAPAIHRADGTEEWYHRGLLHREGGPAVENMPVYVDGPTGCEFYLMDIYVEHGKLVRTATRCSVVIRRKKQ